MSQTLSKLRELLLQYRRANGAGSVKIANAMIPDIIDNVIEYVDETTGKTSTPSSDDYDWFKSRLDSCENRYGVGSPHCEKIKNQLSMLEDAIAVASTASSPERRVFTIDVGNLPPEQAAEYVASIKQGMKLKSIPVSLDMSSMTEEEQAAYIEAQYRVQGIKNNGARYIGDESLVHGFIDQIKNGPKGETCAPCTVDPATGVSAIDAAYEPLTIVEDHSFPTEGADVAKIFKTEKPAAPKAEKQPVPTKAAKKTVSRAAPKRAPKK